MDFVRVRSIKGVGAARRVLDRVADLVKPCKHAAPTRPSARWEAWSVC